MAKALGTTDAVTTCDCCGKVNLKLTVAMELDDGQIVHYGRVCAARNTGKTQPQIAGEIKVEAARILAAAVAEFRADPAQIAYRAKLAARPRNMIGRDAMAFVAVESEAEDLARARIAAKFGLNPWQVWA